MGHTLLYFGAPSSSLLILFGIGDAPIRTRCPPDSRGRSRVDSVQPGEGKSWSIIMKSTKSDSMDSSAAELVPGTLEVQQVQTLVATDTSQKHRCQRSQRLFLSGTNVVDLRLHF